MISAETVAFVALAVVAGAAAGVLFFNPGAAKLRTRSLLDEAPQVVRWPQTLALVIGLGLALALGLALIGTVFLAPMGLIAGAFVAFTVRAARLRAWAQGVTRETQALIGNLVIELDSGEGSLYRALEVTVSEGDLPHLRPLVERYVLGRVTEGAYLEDALLDLGRSRLLSYAPVTADALRRLGNLAGRNLPISSLLDALRIMNDTMTDIVRVEQDQLAQSAQIRYSAYIVAALVVTLAALLVLMARDLGDALLRTLPGNISLTVVTLMVLTGLVRAEYSASSSTLRF
jgi:Flp pilus assembly protein TadB